MKEITKRKITLVVLAAAPLALLPVAWSVGVKFAPDAGPHPMSWPFILLPFAGIFMAVNYWPTARATKL